MVRAGKVNESEYICSFQSIKHRPCEDGIKGGKSKGKANRVEMKEGTKKNSCKISQRPDKSRRAKYVNFFL